jgi:acylphosphatase
VQKNSGSLKGWVKNSSTGAVEVVAEGDEEELKKFLARCKQGPASAKISDIDVTWGDATGEFDSFEIRY